MTVITHARRKSRLAKLIESAGGLSIGAALTQARANLDKLKPQGLEEVAARIDELASISEPAEADADQLTAAMGQAYRAANGIIDAAGPFDLEPLCAVAIGLCDLIDAASPVRPFDWRVVPVHAQTLKLLFALPPEAQAERAALLNQINDLVDRKLSQADLPPID